MTTASAQPAPSDARARAEELFGSGVEAFRRARRSDGEDARTLYRQALSRFRASYRARPAPVALYNIARAERALALYAQAIRDLRRYAADVLPGMRPTRTEVLEEIAELERLIAVLRLDGVPAGATVRIDGRRIGLGDTPDAIVLDPGRHVLEVTAPEHRSEVRELRLVAGEVHRVALRLVRIRRPARLVIDADADGEYVDVYLDGSPWGLAPWAGDVPAGRHTLRFEADGHYDYEQEIVVAPGQERRVFAPMRARTVWRSPVFWSIVGAVVIGGTIATVILLQPPPESVAGNYDPAIVQALTR